jgi:hypothetical protein
MIFSALRYAVSATAGIPSAPEGLTTTAGGGVDMVAAAMCKLIGARSTATTAGPDGPLLAGARAATGVMAAPRKGVVGVGSRGAAAPTAPASTRGAIMATLDTGVHIERISCWDTAARPRCLRQTIKAVNDLRPKVGRLASGITR